MSVNFNGSLKKNTIPAQNNQNAQNNEEVASKKSKTKKTAAKIATAAAVTAVIVGGVALYVSSKNKKLGNAKNNPVETLKQKAKSVYQNVNNFVKKESVAPKASDINNTANVNNIKKAEVGIEKEIVKEDKILALPEKSTATLDKEQAENLKQIIINEHTSVYPEITYKEPVQESEKNLPAIVKKGVISVVKPNIDVVQNPVVIQEKGATLDIIDTSYIENSQSGKTTLVSGIKDALGSLFKKAKENAKTLRTGAVGVAGGAAIVKTTDKIKEVKKDDNKEIKITVDGNDFKGKIEDGRAFDVNGNPLTNDVVINYSNGKKTIMKYDNGTLMQSIIYGNADDEVPETIKNYTDGKISTISSGLKAVDSLAGKIGYIADTTTVLKNYFAVKKTINKDGKIVEQYFKRNVDKDGNIKGKPILAYSVRPEVLNNGAESRSFSIPVENGERLVRKSEGSFATKTITLMSLDESPLGVMVLDKFKNPQEYKLFVDGVNDGVIGLKDGKVADVKNLREVSIEHNPNTLETLTEYASDLNESKITVLEDGNGNVKRIENYSLSYSENPDCATDFVDGLPVCDTFYDKNGNVVFKPKYSLKR